jgi:uncharacterized protein YecA (UPF0149 family)
LEDDGTPEFVFRRMYEKYTENYQKIMRQFQNQNLNFDFATDFESLMDHYKPTWREKYPSVHPINERLKKYLYKQLKVERNAPCPCGSSKKFKKCCGA